MTDDVMTRQERTLLSQVAKQRARAAKSSVAHRKAQLLADYEEQSSALYASEDAAWAEVVEEGRRAIAQANRRVQQVCEERNIPAELAPSIGTYWAPRGANADPKRRAELRKLAERQIDAAARQTVAAIDRAEADVQVELLTGALTTDAARAFLDSIPTPEALMPPLRLDELERSVPRNSGRRALR
jgi:hypothetical protein